MSCSKIQYPAGSIDSGQVLRRRARCRTQDDGRRQRLSRAHAGQDWTNLLLQQCYNRTDANPGQRGLSIVFSSTLPPIGRGAGRAPVRCSGRVFKRRQPKQQLRAAAERCRCRWRDNGLLENRVSLRNDRHGCRVSPRPVRSPTTARPWKAATRQGCSSAPGRHTLVAQRGPSRES